MSDHYFSERSNSKLEGVDERLIRVATLALNSVLSTLASLKVFVL